MKVGRREFFAVVGIAAGPSATHAQQRATVGLLSSATMAEWAQVAVRKGLADEGFVEGRNLIIVTRSAEGQLDRLPALAADLVGQKVAAIFAAGGPVPTRAAKAATASIPIVFAYGGDPVADGLVPSLSRPGGNVTGATFIGISLTAKRLQLLHEIAPKATELAILVNPNGTLAESQVKDAQAAMAHMGLRLRVLNAVTDAEIDAAYATMAQDRIGGVLVSTDPTFGFKFRDKLIGLAARHRLAAVYDSRDFAKAGGLIIYGSNLGDTWRQAGRYVGRILKGEKPADLPVLQATRYETIVNLKTAKALGIEIPQKVLLDADETIE
jgi:putative tryptophan/tyrosine transport system substrate-binding protein